MRLSVVASTLVAALAPQAAEAWYLQVHNQIGYMAEGMLSNNARYFIGQILEPEYHGSIGRAASWADTVSKSTAPYSYGWHWISAKDTPPNDCGLYYHRDCQNGGCVVNQIYNQTNILKGCMRDLHQGRYTPDIDCQQALKWVIHFIGDIHEPMHTSEKAYGGNLFKVTFKGEKTNLHQTWDRWILYDRAGAPNGFSDKRIDPFFEYLQKRIYDDQFREPKKAWDSCDWQVNRMTYCPEKWAKETNAITCDYAYGKFVNETTDLWPEYSRGAWHIVDLQLAKAAWRLAGWLNQLATNEFGSSTDAIDLPGGVAQADIGMDWEGQDAVAESYEVPLWVVEEAVTELEESYDSAQRSWKIWEA